MADYWKSNAKKFCDFCKCWIADNKPSVDFHEKGKRHKENVALRLKNISRQSIKEQKERQKMDEDFKKMEKAAIQAYMKDVERNADYTSLQLNKKLNEANSSTLNDDDDDEKEVQKDANEKSEASESKTSNVWYEAVSDEGYTYYWNTETGESVWEPPKSGYISLDNQKKLETENKKREEEEKQREIRKKRLEEAKKNEEKEKLMAEERRAFLEREKLKSLRVKEEKLPKETEVVIGPAPRANPYGSWVAVPQKKPKQVDLQLPQHKKIEIKVPVINMSEPEIKFREKNVVGLESEGNEDVNFKRRKLNIGSKKNLRQRLDDD